MRRSTLAVFTGTGCRACEHAILDIHHQVASLTPAAEIAFWPFVMGHQWEDLERLSHLDVCVIAGAVCTEDDRHAVETLRGKSHIMIACGACAAFGGLPGLANLRPAVEEHAASAPKEDEPPSLPRLAGRVSAVSGVVEVDYVVPGCPPTQGLLWAALQTVLGRGEATSRVSFACGRLPESLALALTAGVLPRKGTTFGGEKAVCASCSRVKEEKKFSAPYRPFEPAQDTGRCLLEQGLVCQGLATREGCGGLCTAVGAPCRGCFGKATDIYDAGAKMVSAISSTFDTTDGKEARAIADKFVDLAGTFYRYTLAEQCVLLSRDRKE
ncbi:MAG: hypothetical protein AB1646_09380 [Thermodesulfobacteriota bacterium]